MVIGNNIPFTQYEPLEYCNFEDYLIWLGELP